MDIGAASDGARYAKLVGYSVIPLTAEELSRAAKEPTHRQILTSRFGNNVTVSTVFTGINFGGHAGKPDIWFQTTILGSDEWTKQYRGSTTYWDALEAHDATLRDVIASAKRQARETAGGGHGLVASR